MGRMALVRRSVNVRWSGRVAAGVVSLCFFLVFDSGNRVESCANLRRGKHTSGRSLVSRSMIGDVETASDLLTVPYKSSSPVLSSEILSGISSKN